MLKSFRDVDKNFAEQIVGIRNFAANQLNLQFNTLEETASPFVAELRSATKSIGYTDEKNLSVPAIIIYGETPTLRDGYFVSEKREFGDIRKSSDAQALPDIITEFFDPLPLVFRYEVSVAASDYDHYVAMCQWIVGNFMYGQQKHFDFNKTWSVDSVFGEISDGEPVEYDCKKLSEPIRSDSISESIYEFKVYPYVFVKEPQDVAVVQRLVAGLKI